MSSDTGNPKSVEAAASALERTAAALLRWSTRAEVRRSLLANNQGDLSTTDAWLLGRIADLGPFRLSQLAAWQEVDKSTMTSQIRRLERKGLVARAVDATDRRGVLVGATPEGKALHRKNKAAARAVFRGFVADWPERDQLEFSRLATRLAVTLEGSGTSPDVPPPGGKAGRAMRTRSSADFG